MSLLHASCQFDILCRQRRRLEPQIRVFTAQRLRQFR